MVDFAVEVVDVCDFLGAGLLGSLCGLVVEVD